VKNQSSFECIALLLQGGGALGSYQGGVYQALAEAGIEPNWVAGISIGAINAAIIAGNAPENRLDRLRDFWESITLAPPVYLSAFTRNDIAHNLLNRAYANVAMFAGVSGFFKPRMTNPWVNLPGPDATSFYDTTPLKPLLERLIDFDRINSGAMRFSVGAVNVCTGNFTYFDNTTHTIGPEHVMASGGLPPGFPAIEVDNEHYWDGGLVSNTPLDWVLGSKPQQDTLAFQVDLWSAQGELPNTMPKVLMRQKEIQYSSRTRYSTDRFRHIQKLRYAVANILDHLPKELQKLPDVEFVRPEAVRKVYNIVELIYRTQSYEGDSKDYEFSRRSMELHWKAGYFDTIASLKNKRIFKRSDTEIVQTFDAALETENEAQQKVAV